MWSIKMSDPLNELTITYPQTTLGKSWEAIKIKIGRSFAESAKLICLGEALVSHLLAQIKWFQV